jgi:hypothetical protein
MEIRERRGREERGGDGRVEGGQGLGNQNLKYLIFFQDDFASRDSRDIFQIVWRIFNISEKPFHESLQFIRINIFISLYSAFRRLVSPSLSTFLPPLLPTPPSAISSPPSPSSKLSLTYNKIPTRPPSSSKFCTTKYRGKPKEDI